MEIHGNTIIQVALLESFGRRYYDVPHGTRIYAWGTKGFVSSLEVFWWGQGGGWTEQERVRIGSSRSDSCCVIIGDDLMCFFKNGLWLRIPRSWSIFSWSLPVSKWLASWDSLIGILPEMYQSKHRTYKGYTRSPGWFRWLFRGWHHLPWCFLFGAKHVHKVMPMKFGAWNYCLFYWLKLTCLIYFEIASIAAVL